MQNREKGFSGLDGTNPDMTPRERRKELIESGISFDAVFDESTLRNDEGELDTRLIRAEKYTLSGLIIEKMWEYLKNRDDIVSQEDARKIPIDGNFWKAFNDQYIGFVQISKDTFAKKFEEFTEENPSVDSLLVARYFRLSQLAEDNAGLPSFSDFITIYTRLARVAEEKFIEEFGRLPKRDEYSQILKEKSFIKMMVQMMFNSREASIPLLSVLEGTTQPNLNDTSRSFLTNRFELKEIEPDLFSLLPKEEIMEIIRVATRKLIDTVEKEKGSRPQVLRCPVIYLGIFQEMCDWLFREFSFHYLDQKYPEI